MSKHYDAVIIGAGHNGLVTAAYLAKAGMQVLVLEARKVLGGAAATQEVFPGFKFNTGAEDAGLFRAEIIEQLNLPAFGLEFIEPPAAATYLFSGQNLTIWPHDLAKTQAEIRKFSAKDADHYPEFLKLIEKFSAALKRINFQSPPDVFDLSLGDALTWGPIALAIRQMGGDDMMEFLRVLPMSAKEFLDEHFESEPLKALLGTAAVSGTFQGPYSAGTAFIFLSQQLGETSSTGNRLTRAVKGGMGQLSASLGAAAQKYGAEVRTDARVRQVLLDNGTAKGVLLESGEEIHARLVVSNADPRRTLFDLVGPPQLEPRVMRRVRNIKFRGSLAKLNFALSSLPDFPNGLSADQLSGKIVICPSLEYLEHAYDDARMGGISQHPYLEIHVPTLLDASLAPDGQHILSVNFKYAPYQLKERSWDASKEELARITLDTLEAQIPGLAGRIRHQQVITPLDLEREYGLTEGSIYHGQMTLDQLLIMRPIPDYARYATQIENLYLCGAGTHPGGGVTGAPGYLAAKEILKST